MITKGTTGAVTNISVNYLMDEGFNEVVFRIAMQLLCEQVAQIMEGKAMNKAAMVSLQVSAP